MARIISIKHDDGRKVSELYHARVHDILDGLVAERCAACGKEYGKVLHIGAYDHGGGDLVVADIPRQWLSVECSCGYHTSFNKFRRAK